MSRISAQAHGCGLTIEPGDGAGLAGTIERLMGAPDEAAAMGARDRRMIDERFSKARALARWGELIT